MKMSKMWNKNIHILDPNVNIEKDVQKMKKFRH